MTLMKIALAGAILALLLIAAQDQRWFERAGVTGKCVPTPAPRSQPGGAWYACKQGLLNGFPNLEGDTCVSAGIVEHQEIWRCRAPIASVPGA